MDQFPPMAPRKQAQLLLAGQQAGAPMDILPPVARQPQFPSGSEPSYVQMMQQMFASGAIPRETYLKMMTDPRQLPPGYGGPFPVEGQ